MKTFSVIILLTLIYYKTSGQDIVYLKNGETLGGLITVRGEEHIRFKNNITNKGERIENDRIERYYLGRQKSYYYPREIPQRYLHFGATTSTYFVKQVVGGKIKVYLFSFDGLDIPMPTGADPMNRYNQPWTNKAKQYFIEKEDKGMKAVHFELLNSTEDKKKNEDSIAEFFSDHPDMVGRFRADKKTIKKLIAYAEEYNKWARSK